MVFGIYNYRAYKPTNITGGHHLVGIIQRKDVQLPQIFEKASKTAKQHFRADVSQHSPSCGREPYIHIYIYMYCLRLLRLYCIIYTQYVFTGLFHAHHIHIYIYMYTVQYTYTYDIQCINLVNMS